jgi:hypothetical protein
MGIAFKAAAALLAANAGCAAWLAWGPEPQAEPALARSNPEALAPLSQEGLSRARQARELEVARCVSLFGMDAAGREQALAVFGVKSSAKAFEEAKVQAWRALGPAAAEEGPFDSRERAKEAVAKLGARWSVKQAPSKASYEVRLGPWRRKDIEELGKIAKASWGAQGAAECDATQFAKWSQAQGPAR